MITIHRKTLLEALGVLQGVVGTKTMLPIYHQIHVECIDDRVRFRASNLEMGAEIWLYTIEGSEPLKTTTVPARRFAAVVSQMLGRQGDYLDFENLAGDGLKITGAGECWEVPGLDPQHFPAVFEEDEVTRVCEVKAEQLAIALARVSYAAGLSIQSAGLESVLIRLHDLRYLEFTACDGRRLARDFVQCSGDPEPIEAVLPKSSVPVLLAALKAYGDEQAEIATVGKRIEIKTGDCRFSSHLLESKYPDVHRGIASPFNVSITVESEPLTRFAKTCQNAAVPPGVPAVIIATDGEQVTLDTDQAIEGAGAATLDIEASVGEFDARRLDARFIQEAIAHIGTEQVKIAHPDAGGFVSLSAAGDEEDERGEHYIMPMRL